VSQRYIDVTPQGAARGLASPRPDLPARLLRGLLLRPPGQPWDTAELEHWLPGQRADATRALFQLQREQCIAVLAEAPAAARGDAGPEVAATLLDGDGFVLARLGRGPEPEDNPLRPPPAADLTLHVGQGTLAARYGVALQGCALADCNGLVAWARQLLQLRETAA
jgi:hypothetical protein